MDSDEPRSAVVDIREGSPPPPPPSAPPDDEVAESPSGNIKVQPQGNEAAFPARVPDDSRSRVAMEDVALVLPLAAGVSPSATRLLAPTDFVGAGHHGPRQAPCFNHETDAVYVPRGSSVLVCRGGGNLSVEIESVSLGLSDVVVAAAYDPALRVLLIGDQNGLASRLVALDPTTAAVRWASPAGALNSCCGLAVLPQQSLVIASSLSELHVLRTHSGESVHTLRGVCSPTFLAADAATGTVFASTIRRGPSGTLHVVSAFRWDADRAALDSLGEVTEAGLASAPRPLAVARAASPAPAHLIVGTCGTPDLLVLALPACRLVHRAAAPPAGAGGDQPEGARGEAAVAGLAADPSGSLLAIVDAAGGGCTRIVAWPLPGMPPLAPRRDEAGGGGSEEAFVCLACRRRIPGYPSGACSLCAHVLPLRQHRGGVSPPLLEGWLCAECYAQHKPPGRLAGHGGTAHPIRVGLEAPLVIAMPSPVGGVSPISPSREAGAAGGSSQRLPQPLLLAMPQACILRCPAPTLCVPHGSGVSFFDGRGRRLPGLGAAALGLAAGAVANSAFDGDTGTLLVADGARVVAIDIDTRAVRWSVDLPSCIGLCVLPRGMEPFVGNAGSRWWGAVGGELLVGNAGSPLLFLTLSVTFRRAGQRRVRPCHCSRS